MCIGLYSSVILVQFLTAKSFLLSLHGKKCQRKGQALIDFTSVQCEKECNKWRKYMFKGIVQVRDSWKILETLRNFLGCLKKKAESFGTLEIGSLMKTLHCVCLHLVKTVKKRPFCILWKGCISYKFAFPAKHSCKERSRLEIRSG